MTAKDFFGNWIVKNIILAIIFILLVTGSFELFLRCSTDHGDSIAVPDFSSMTVKDASRLAKKSSITLEVVDSVFVTRQQKGTVVRQVPSPGSKVKKGRRIQLIINAVNPKMIPMPNLVGYSLRSAKAEIEARGLEIGKLIYVSDIATNNVLSQVYSNVEIEPGTLIPSESKIDLVLGINSAENTTGVPSLTGLRYRNAVSRIFDHSLNVGSVVFDKSVRTYQDSLNAFVFSQTPAPDGGIIVMGRPVSIRLTIDSSKLPE